MSNKLSSQSQSRLLDNKLSVLFKEINDSISEIGAQEKEQLLITFNSTIERFYKTLTSPLFSPDEINRSTHVDYRQLNKMFKEVSQDLEIIYREIESMQNFAVENFNSLNALSSSIRARIKEVSSELGDYQLYANDPLGGAVYFSDRFDNTDKVDLNEELYDEDQCFVDANSGIVTLPIDTGETEERDIETISVGSASNGLVGNNQEVGALRRGNLSYLSDGDPETWFEYESVSREDSPTPLVLEFKIKLDSEEIVNAIEIETHSFKAKRYPKITKMEVSVDGSLYTSVIDDVSGRVKTNGSSVIFLEPSSENISDTNKLYITPRKIKYINIVIQQDDSYIIRTPSGTSFRKAIGIKNLNLIGQAYENVGEIVSVNYQSPAEINKLALTSKHKDALGLTQITHYVSENDGQDWHEIERLESYQTDAPQILNFNNGADNEIVTDSPVTSLRHKVKLERLDQGFSPRGGVVERLVSKTEFTSLSPETQSITIDEQPIVSSVSLFNVSYGSVGRDSYYHIPFSEAIERDGFIYVYLPNSPFRKMSIEEDQEIVIINQETWGRVADIKDAGTGDKVYEFDYINNIIIFGDGDTGVKPSTSINFGLKREQVIVSNDAPRELQTAFDADGVEDTTSVYRLTDEKTTRKIFRRASKVHPLGVENVTTVDVTEDDGNVLLNEVNFINGYAELDGAGDYSIDKLNGVLYSYLPTPSDGNTEISITYRERVEVQGITFNNGRIQIPESSYVSDKVNKTINITSPTSVIDLGENYIEPRSLRFLTLSSDFTNQVPFVGDGSEFNLDLSPSELQGYYTIDYKNGIIYTYSNVSGSLIVEFNKTDYYAEYNIAVRVPQTEYTINADESTIELSDSYIIRAFSSSLEIPSLRNLFRVEYDYAEEINQNPKELEPYFTPFLKSYEIAAITRDML